MGAIVSASDEPSREVVIMLLEAEADPTQRDCTGVTPFIESAKAGNVPLMKLLLNATRGCVLRDVDDSYRSALHWAAHEGEDDSIELLLKADADAEARDAEGKK